VDLSHYSERPFPGRMVNEVAGGGPVGGRGGNHESRSFARGSGRASAAYVNYIAVDEPDRIRAAYGPNWDRLVRLKRRWDPDNVFHLNQNIDPSS
jgi:berberine-like enzyme